MLIGSDADARELADLIRTSGTPIIGFDTEYTGPVIRNNQGDTYVDVWAPSARLVGFSVALGLGREYYVPVGHNGGGNVSRPEALRVLEVLERGHLALHGAMADARMLNRWLGRPWVPNQYDDTVLMGWLLERRVPGGGGYQLKELARRYLGVSNPTTFEDLLLRHRATGIDELDPAAVVEYACADARYTRALFTKWEPELAANPTLWDTYRGLELRIQRILARMEDRGALIDVERVRTAGEPIYRLGESLSWDWYGATGLAPTQQEKIAAQLYGTGVWQAEGAPRTDKGRLSVSRAALEYQRTVLPEDSHGHELATMLLTWEATQKLRTTYLPRLEAYGTRYADNRLRETYAQHRTDTGRLASASPILTMPVRNPALGWLRECVVAAPGYDLIVADYSNLELRILAHLSRSPVLIEAFHAGADPHASVAALLNGVPLGQVTKRQRDVAKTLQYAVLYGAGPSRVAHLLAITKDEARAVMDDYWERMSDVKVYIDGAVAFCRAKGWCRTWLGRRRTVPDINHECHTGCPVNKWGRHQCGRRAYAERIAVNTPIQGTAADIIKSAMVAWDDSAPEGAHLIAQVHDELIVEAKQAVVPVAKATLEHVMRSVGSWRVPLAVDAHVGHNWAQAKG